MSETVDTNQRVVLDYTSRDYKAIRAQLVGLAKGLLPEWETAGEPGDFGTLLLELFAYSSDVMNYYADRVAAEAFLGTAARRQSAMFIADMLGYTPAGQRAATVPVTFTWTWDVDSLASEGYSVSAASIANNVATLSLQSDRYIDIVPGQVIDVFNLTTGAYNGRHVVRSVVSASTGQDFQVTYPVSTTPNGTEASIPANAEVQAGNAIVIPANTAVTGRVGDTTLRFETDFEVVIDTVNGRDTAPNSGQKTTSVSVTATEGTSVLPVKIGTSSGIPNAEFVLSDPGVINNTVTVYTKEGGQVVTWAEVEKISLASPTQSAYATYIDDENYTHVVFGDGAAGRVPPVNAEILVSYRYGVGAVANTAAVNSLTTHDDEVANDAGVVVTNTAVPSGGADVESIDSIRYSVPRSNALKQRAVTLDDYVSLALQVPGINKAVAYGSNYTTVYVRVAAGPESTGYLTTSVTGKHIADGTALLTLAKDAIISPGQVLYVSDVTGVLGAGINTAAAVRTFYQTQPIRITNVSADGTADTLTVTTDKAHGFTVGQPVTLADPDGVLTATYSYFAGTHVVLSRTATALTVKIGSNISAAGPTVVTNTGVTVSGTSGVTFATTESATNGWVADPGSITTTDPGMQRLINTLEQYLSDKKLIGSVVYGEPVEWTNVDLDIHVNVRPLYNRESVRAAAQAAVSRVFEFNNVSFGKRISVGDVYRAALAVDGVDYVTINTMTWAGGGGRATVSNKALTSNIATLTTSEAHYFSAGQVVKIAGVGSPFNGTYVITSTPTATTFTFERVNANVSSAAVSPTGTATVQSVVDVNSSSADDPLGDPQNAYRIPRINPALSEPWVSASGGLANT